MRWLKFVGFVVHLMGLMIFAWPIMFPSDDDTEDASATTLSGAKEKNPKQPAGHALMHRLKYGWWGVGLIVGGFALGAVADFWPR